MQRTLIISDQLLFAQGLRTLIETQIGIQVICIEQHCVNLLEQVAELQPDIIILSENHDAPSSLPLALLDTAPQVRIIRLSLDGNLIHIYDGHQSIANCAGDLIATLNQSLAPNANLNATGNAPSSL
jgi:DNA-binding NarL/FixJ family response regulator